MLQPLQGLGADEGPEEGHLGLVDQRQRRQRGVRADVAEQRKHVLGDERLGVGLAALGLEAGVEQAFEMLLTRAVNAGASGLARDRPPAGQTACAMIPA